MEYFDTCQNDTKITKEVIYEKIDTLDEKSLPNF